MIRADQKTALHQTVIEPPRGWTLIPWRDLWKYRELLYFLVWRDLKARYKQTFFGVAWAIFQPLLATLVFTVVFSLVVKISTGDIPYPVFSYTALLPWTYFSRSLERAANSLVDSSQLLTKVYFPRLLIPTGAVVSGLVDMAFAFVVLVGLIFYYGIRPTGAIWTLPLFVLLAFIAAFGVGLWLAALNVYYRDVKYITPFIIQVWMYATPVIYPLSMVPDRFRFLYGLNPMVGVVEGFRWALLGTGNAPGTAVGISALIASLILLSGLFFFYRMEDSFADVV